jgi:hypothetical protein
MNHFSLRFAAFNANDGTLVPEFDVQQSTQDYFVPGAQLCSATFGPSPAHRELHKK